jgi:hypothetical protein
MSDEQKLYLGLNAQLVKTLVVEFADGSHGIPPHIVAALGGEEPILKQAKDLRGITFEQFMRGFHRTMTRATLNNFQQQLISQHMRSFR